MAEVGPAVIDEVDWSAIHHVYGPATDLPGHLRALLGPDRAARDAGLDRLYAAALHGGTLTGATWPVVRVLLGIVEDPAVEGVDVTWGPATDPVTQPLRLGLVGYVESALQDAAESPDPTEPEARAVAALAAPVLARLADASDLDLRLTAVSGLGWAADVVAESAERDRVVGLLSDRRDVAAEREDLDELCELLVVLGQLGVDTETWLTHPHLAVAASAALAPALASSRPALDVLVAALGDESATDAVRLGPVERPGPFPAPLARAIAARAGSFGEVADLAVDQVARDPLDAPATWPAFFALAFTPPGPGDGPLTADQARYLAILVERDDVWDPMSGLLFRDAGLPHDRVACARMAGVRPRPAGRGEAWISRRRRARR